MNTRVCAREGCERSLRFLRSDARYCGTYCAAAARRDRKARRSPSITSGGNPQCTPTTSEPTFLHLAVSGRPLPVTPSNCSASISPSPAPAPRKPSCVSSAPPINDRTITRLRREIPSPADVQPELEDDWRAIDGRRLRGHLGGGHVEKRCPGCREFVRNPNAPHHCGYFPGRGYAA